MNRKFLSTALCLLPGLLLSSCSGVKQVCTVNCVVQGNATLSLVLTATPPDPASQLSIHAFAATITGITLTPSTGSDFPVPLNANTYIAEFNRVTSDSTVLAANVSIPAATYTQITINFSAPRVTFCTQTNPGVPGCAFNTLTSVSGAAGSVILATNLVLGANQQTGLAINTNLGNTLTLNGQIITAVNFGAANVFSVATLPPAAAATDLTAGQLSHIDDVMGVVSNVSGSTLTIHTTTRGDLTATASGATQFSTTCATQTFACVQLNAVAVVDAILNTDGTFTLTFYRPLSSVPQDLIEGVVTSVPNSITNQFTLVATDSVFSTGVSLLSGRLNLGDQITVTLTTPQPFFVVSKGLIVAVNNFDNSSSITAIQPGQTVLFSPSVFTAQSGVTPGTATTNQFGLRFTRISFTMASVAPPIFNANTFAAFFGITLPEQFQTTTGRLSLDGVSNIGSISAGTTVSSSALFLGTPATPVFAAQTVRTH